MDATYNDKLVRPQAAWGAVFSMALCVAVLIASEFMPVSLLTPIADGLGISEGRAGQAISVSGIFAVVTSLFIADLAKRIDRKLVLTSFSLLLVVSGLVVTFAPDYAVLMIGRALLGVAIGGFWSMSTAIVMRLVPQNAVPKGLAMINAGNAIAATVSAPLGSLLGDHVGWRGAFFLVVPLALLALIWQWIGLPALPPRRREGSGNVFKLLLRRQVALGMAAIFLLFMGQFALFTYLRPFLETVTGVGVSTLSAILLLMGLAGVAGTWTIGQLLQERLYSILIGIPLVMALLASALIALGSVPAAVTTLLVGWGFFGTAAPVGWGTWLSRTLPDDAEAGGGLQVAVIQFAITLGAATGGVLFDALGWWSPFALGAALLLGSALAATAAAIEHGRAAQ
ncbi:MULTISPECIES: MFS transporter [Bradyrhizobium]|jgi:predicted MFS family arabinose efflux permease|uniref:MFS transporter n=1 Tax=Bradyrhizobium TaxID=374 RepID=UPI0004835321|nr:MULTISPECIES: MFS transporter [Bradyrhizobium]MCS3450279.1 putative MFS family arabinose efflux permease [Bradyrhizobium elkanii]MCS3558576.1 putative MFS family arabinose efflux permease [Bradyrhizobium elkanii]MCW2151577.1 putative MFS family arabinose efflux permease [Bradyrhizobium elkanii]MCW2358550.1 putative MFS family arabinose efflux permease [Bradyrhizobium elkanii]MCW2375308.1 putative MFS family arabinose efflux permease [Bradyrhizobium elkanii]